MFHKCENQNKNLFYLANNSVDTHNKRTMCSHLHWEIKYIYVHFKFRIKSVEEIALYLSTIRLWS